MKANEYHSQSYHKPYNVTLLKPQGNKVSLLVELFVCYNFKKRLSSFVVITEIIWQNYLLRPCRLYSSWRAWRIFLCTSMNSTAQYKGKLILSLLEKNSMCYREKWLYGQSRLDRRNFSNFTSLHNTVAEDRLLLA